MTQYFSSISFGSPFWLLLLAIIPAIVVYYIWRNKKQFASIKLPSLAWTSNLKPSAKIRFRHLPFIIKMICLALLSIVMARPQTENKQEESNIEGIDIVIALDISGSMIARDLLPDRITAAKEVAKTFIDQRPNDRIGLVLFSGEAFTQCPLTTDHIVLKKLFDSIKIGMIEDGTAIGDGLATAINRIKDSKAKSKVIILLTDGLQNTGNIDPIAAGEIAKNYGIRLYTIGIGSKGEAPVPVMTPFGEQIVKLPVDLDEKMLKEIAKKTDGEYFRATNKTDLINIYKEIDKLEKSKIEVNIFKNKNEEYLYFALTALVLLIIATILKITIFKIKP